MPLSHSFESSSSILLVLLICLIAAGAPVRAEESIPVKEEASQDQAQGAGAIQEGTREPRKNHDLQDLSLEELMDIEVQTVVSASRYRQKVNEAPASVTIITARDIRKFGYRTLADILGSVRGFSTTYDRNYQYVGVRGFGRPGDYNTRILLLVDGHRLNDAIYDSAAIGTEFVLDVDLIERVEVTRGPGSSLYGSNAFFAVVNVITRRAKDLGAVELSGEAGTQGAYKGRLSYGASRQHGKDFLLSVSGFTRAGDRLYFPEFDPENPMADPRAGNGGYSDNGDHDKYQSGYAKFEHRGFQLAAAYIERTKGIPTASFGTDFNEPGNRTRDGRGYVDLQYETRLDGGMQLDIRTYYDQYRYEGDYLYTGTLNKDRAIASWYGGDIRITTRLLNAHHVIIGTEYEDRIKQDQYNADVSPASVYLDDHRNSSTWAAYAQDEISISPIFLLYAGIRYDHISTFGGTTNPRIAAIITPIEHGTLKLLYGKAFRAPTVYELYYEAPPSMLNNPALQPERIETYELVYEHNLGNGLRAVASHYSYSIKNLITQTYDPSSGTTSFQNQERAEAEGTELEVQKSWPNSADIRFSYAFQKAVDPKTGELLTNSPKHLAKLNLVVPIIKDRFFTGIEEQVTGPRMTTAGRSTEGFAVTNLTLFGSGRQRTMEASLSIYNVLNRKYEDPVSSDLFPIDSVQQDGRSIRVKLTYAF
jgi:iron complex outermembrane receptor protein